MSDVIPLNKIKPARRTATNYVGINPNSNDLLEVSYTIRLWHVLTAMRRLRESGEQKLLNSWQPTALAINEYLNPKYKAMVFGDRSLEIVECESGKVEYEILLPLHLSAFIRFSTLVERDGIIPFHDDIKFIVKIPEKYMKGTPKRLT